MRSYLIDPHTQQITEVEHNGDYRQIYEFIQARPFTVVTINDKRDGIFVDDEGLYREGQRFFKLEGYEQPIAGRGLVLGCDDEGETVAPTITLSELKGRISWVRPDLQFDSIETSEEEIDHPVFGKMTHIRNEPSFTFRKKEDKA